VVIEEIGSLVKDIVMTREPDANWHVLEANSEAEEEEESHCEDTDCYCHGTKMAERVEFVELRVPQWCAGDTS